MASASNIDLEHMKNEQVTMKDGAMVGSTDILDGPAKDSPVFNATNETVQYKTPNIPKDDLGGRNNLNG